MRQEAPTAPMFSEKLIAERLDQIGDDRSGGGPVKKDNLIHGERATEPRLIAISASHSGGGLSTSAFSNLMSGRFVIVVCGPHNCASG